MHSELMISPGAPKREQCNQSRELSRLCMSFLKKAPRSVSPRWSRTGYVVDLGELYEVYCSIAVPIRKAAGDVIAALCCGGWLNQLPQDFEDFLLREMIPAAEEFSRVFGQFEPW